MVLKTKKKEENTNGFLGMNQCMKFGKRFT